MVYWGWLGSHPATIALKYFGQAVATWRVLLRERPDVVFVMSPPPIAVMVAFPYCAARRIPFVIDIHTGAFWRRWRFFQPVQFWLCRRAVTTIVHNDHYADVVRAKRAHATVVPDVPIEFKAASERVGLTTFTVVFATSFSTDEPLDAMIQAARLLPQVNFLITGRPTRQYRQLARDFPPNLALTGFVDAATYGDLLRQAGVVVALTTGDHTMQRAAYEAIYHGTPVIVSDYQVLREAFDDGAVHVDNSPEAIVAAVRRVRANLDEFKNGAHRLRARKADRWLRTKSELLNLIEQRQTRR